MTDAIYATVRDVLFMLKGLKADHGVTGVQKWGFLWLCRNFQPFNLWPNRPDSLVLSVSKQFSWKHNMYQHGLPFSTGPVANLFYRNPHSNSQSWRKMWVKKNEFVRNVVAMNFRTHDDDEQDTCEGVGAWVAPRITCNTTSSTRHNTPNLCMNSVVHISL